jgi:hypothetical protein
LEVTGSDTTLDYFRIESIAFEIRLIASSIRERAVTDKKVY